MKAWLVKMQVQTEFAKFNATGFKTVVVCAMDLQGVQEAATKYFTQPMKRLISIDSAELVADDVISPDGTDIYKE